MQRIINLDIARSLAIYLMVFYHFFYDLNFLGFYDIPMFKHWFWYGLPRVIVFIFMFCVGYSLAIVHTKKIIWKKIFIWEAKLISLATIISLITYFLFPKGWIYFGTLHSIAFCALLSIPFLFLPRTSFYLGMAILISYFIFSIQLPWFKLNHKSMDYIPPYPWIGSILFGIGSSHLKLLEKTPSFLPKSWQFLNFPGKHSLKIYLLHQPILFGTLSLIKLLQTKL